MWFKKKKKKKQCATGAVCAWEYNGKLYKSEKDRDSAEVSHKKEILEKRMGKVIKNYIEVSPWGPHFISADALGKHFLTNWSDISSMASEYRNLVEEGS